MSLLISGPVQVSPSYSTRSVALGTAYQPSAARACLVIVTCSIAVGVIGDDGKVEFLSDSANPPTTVVSTLRLACVIAGLPTAAAPLVYIVKAGDYYKLLATDTSGTPTQAVVGTAQEILL